jgi:hypothetical protein
LVSPPRLISEGVITFSGHELKTGHQRIYAEGVLLESSNAETWTPLNGSDLIMKLYGYEFENEGTVQFQPISGVQFSDLQRRWAIRW